VPTCSHRQTTRCKEVEVPPLARGSGTRFAQDASSVISLDSSPANPATIRWSRWLRNADVSGQRIGTVIMS
jgi:hypothetical protein